MLSCKMTIVVDEIIKLDTLSLIVSFSIFRVADDKSARNLMESFSLKIFEDIKTFFIEVLQYCGTINSTSQLAGNGESVHVTAHHY